MENICEICAKEPGSHSFTYFCRTQKPNIYEYVFYTCIGDAKKYKDSEGIVAHYSGCLNTMNPDKWIWVFNCDGFGLKHYTEVNTITKLANLVKTFGRVEAIYLVNPPKLLDVFFKIVKPILDKDTYGRIKVVKSQQIVDEVLLEKSDKDKLLKLLVPKYD
jgi:hypothetical protein